MGGKPRDTSTICSRARAIVAALQFAAFVQEGKLPATLSVVGAGRAGRTMGRLLAGTGLFQLGDVIAQSMKSAEDAVQFMQGGTARALDGPNIAGDAVLIAVPDDRIATIAALLAAQQREWHGTVVFHLSGAQSSELLTPLTELGACCASVHPLASFADPAVVIARFAGTYCAVEGDARAKAAIVPALHAMGAHVFEIDTADKLVYHAAAVIASNYLVALIDVAVRTAGLAGLSANTAYPMLEPLARMSLDNALKLGARDALTGPIARNDMDLVLREHAALADRDASIAALYRALALHTARLAQRTDPFHDGASHTSA
jgi:predicted short-subunit dehydrogenase-like oxidoreductase (DUF2520 family)